MEFNILLVEDEEEFIEILADIINICFAKEFPEMQIAVHKAYDGKSGLLLVKELQPDVIVTDITMPIMNGLAMMREIRKFNKFVPILALTALTDLEDIENILHSGANNYTSKPLNQSLFLAQIKTFVTIAVNRRFMYNKDAINTVTNKIYKRKIIFPIENENDFMEFWDYTIRYIPESNSLLNLLQSLFEIESISIRKGSENNLICEENDEHYFFTLEHLTISNDELSKILENKHLELQYKFNELENKLSFFIVKEQSKTLQETQNVQKIPNVQKTISVVSDDIRSTIHEQVTAAELLEELDPSIWDKVENFDEDLDDFRLKLYDLEDAKDQEKIKECIGFITDSLEYFIETIDKIGFFNIICRSFMSLIDFLESLELSILENIEKKILLCMTLRALADDLEKWIVHLFFEKSTTEIHYFDASFAENIVEIKMLMDDSEDDDDESLEFF